MTTPAIQLSHLSKRYRIGQREPYGSLRDSLSSAAGALLRRLAGAPGRGGGGGRGAHIWALRDVSFEVQPGEVVGIIGRNGAGKSTLLKILARITEPTGGHGRIRGRIGSLLEVGTGFHPELTGRENIYLNGAILGMKRAEINRKFDEIVAFAEVEQFIDTPVKRYSSGMYMRLAFAVAAHLEPEILIVDEVLAVGDAAFQKKCLGKMGDVASAGRTVLFVSHNLIAVQGLCGRAIWLDRGSIVDEGRPERIISRYLQSAMAGADEAVWADPAAAPGDDTLRLRRVGVRPEHLAGEDAVTVHTPFAVEFEYWNHDPGAHVSASLAISNEHGICVFDIASPFDPDWPRHPSPTGLLRTTCRIPGDLLNAGTHRVSMTLLRNHTPVVEQADVVTIDVQDGSLEQRGGWYGKWQGVIRPALEWETDRLLSPSLPATERPGG